RACDVKGWLGVIRVGRGAALVLSGDATSVAYYRSARGQHYLLRPVYAPSEIEFLDHFHDVMNQLPVESEEAFRHPAGTFHLLSAADVPGRWLTPHAEFVLPRGKYRVLTSHIETEEVD